MPTLVMAGKFPNKIDGSVKAKAYTFLEKLQQDDSAPGLHIEPINGSADPRVRTGRVDQFWRAVMFKLVGQGEPHYIWHGIWPHDEAIAVAKKVTLKQNPINGMPTIEEIEIPAAAPEWESVQAPTEAPAEPTVAPERTAAATEPWLPGLGYRPEQLTDVLGVPDAVAEDAMSLATEDDVIALAGEQKGWLALALLGLATGDPVEQIVDQLGLGAEPSTGDEDEDIVRALRRPGARAHFAFIENQEELRSVIEGGDFAAWRVFLHPEQRRYVEQTANGPFRLSGGAGTGKTVVIVHRARELARRDPDARIVVTTYTTNLADALRDQVTQLDAHLGDAQLGSAGVHVTGVDSLAYAVIQRASVPGLVDAMQAVLGEDRSNPTRRTPGERWRGVVDAYSADLPVEIANEHFLRGEYELVVLPHRVRSEDEYLRVRRQGRGVPLDRERRRAVWRLIEAYRAQARADGSLDFAEAAAVAAAYLDGAGDHPAHHLADHVLVDEGQDLDPTRWQMLRALVATGTDDMFIAEDSHQRIYGPRTVLGRLGIRIVGRSRRLTLNYRTTAQNLHYAMGLLEGERWFDLEGELDETGYRSARTGPQPVVDEVTALGPELETVVRHATTWAKDGVPLETIAVLVPDRQQRERIAKALADAGVPAASVDRERPPTGRVAVMTRHRAKGTEFARVVLTDVGWVPDWELRRLAELDESEREDQGLRNRALLYVAATRARDELVVVRRPH